VEEGLKNLIFLAVALLAWRIKVALERKTRAPRPRKIPSRAGSLRPAAERPVQGSTGEVDVVYGRRQLPEQLTAAPASPVRGVEERAPSALPDTLKKTTLRVQTTGSAGRGSRARRSQRAWRALGVGPTVSGRQAARSAVLWREILGPPRALRGPHRPPSAQRRRP